MLPGGGTSQLPPQLLSKGLRLPQLITPPLVSSGNNEPINDRELAGVSCEEPDSKYFRICGSFSFSCNYSALGVSTESAVRTRAGMCLVKVTYTAAMGQPAVVAGPCVHRCMALVELKAFKAGYTCLVVPAETSLVSSLYKLGASRLKRTADAGVKSCLSPAHCRGTGCPGW